ncbi:hypothetical protein RUM44_006127 [Polyplax serrata]|uniref:Uncharacterized protein n=1 Tax=Polyplax serrata TaxID=468196 RepID=A0ABR1AZ14_POLSC
MSEANDKNNGLPKKVTGNGFLEEVYGGGGGVSVAAAAAADGGIRVEDSRVWRETRKGGRQDHERYERHAVGHLKHV